MHARRLAMEHKGVEPLASTMPLWRATNCANAPNKISISSCSMFVKPFRKIFLDFLDLPDWKRQGGGLKRSGLVYKKENHPIMGFKQT